MEYLVRLEIVVDTENKQFAANEVLDILQNDNKCNIFTVRELENTNDKFEQITATEE
jgi:hypothetical protein